MKNLNISKILFYATIIAVTLIISFGYGLYSGTYRNWIFNFVRGVKSDVEIVFDERDNLAKTRPKNFLQPARYDGSGVTVNKTGNDNDKELSDEKYRIGSDSL